MKKQLINEAFRLQQLAGIQPVNILKEEVEGYSYFYDFEGNKSDEDDIIGTSREPKYMQSIEFANGKSYKIGDVEPEEGGEIIALKKWPNGYEIASEMGRDEDEYQTNF